MAEFLADIGYFFTGAGCFCTFFVNYKINTLKNYNQFNQL